MLTSANSSDSCSRTINNTCLLMAMGVFLLSSQLCRFSNGISIPTSVMFPLTAEVYPGAASVVAMASDASIVSAFVVDKTVMTRTGHLSGLVSKWHEPQDVPGGHEGGQPAIALNSSHELVLVFHKGHNKLHAKTGRLKGSVIEWTEGEVQYDAGHHPSVALNDDRKLVVSHDNGKGKIFYRSGQLDKDLKLSLGQHAHPFDDGDLSRVAINKHGLVIETHKHKGGKIFSRVGLFTNTGAIDWSIPEEFTTGDEHDVAINDAGIVVHVHSRKKKAIYSTMGLFNKASRKIEWDTPRHFEEHTINPAIAINAHKAISLSETRAKTFASVSLIIDRAKWMENMPSIMEKPLWKVTLAGTHDSGAFSLTSHRVQKGCAKASAVLPGGLVRLFAQAQDKSFRGQLDGGIRYFDLRPYYWKREANLGTKIRDGRKKRRRRSDLKRKAIDSIVVGDGDFHAYHDSIGPKIFDIYQDIVNFLTANKKELVILQISHFCKHNFNAEIHKKFIEMTKRVLGKFLFKSDQPIDMHTTTMSEYLKDGSKVVLIYDDKDVADAEGTNNGFWYELFIFDRWSNKDTLGQMKEDQLAKWKDNQPIQSQLFLLSWTLTFIGKVKKTLHEITKAGNRFLPQFIEAHRHELKVNIIYVDYFQESGASDLAIILNNGEVTDPVIPSAAIDDTEKKQENHADVGHGHKKTKHKPH